MIAEFTTKSNGRPAAVETDAVQAIYVSVDAPRQLGYTQSQASAPDETTVIILDRYDIGVAEPYEQVRDTIWPRG